MIKVPEELKEPCIDVRTRYGKFLKKYNYMQRAKTNNLEDDFKKNRVSQMSKYDFVRTYIHNTSFNVLDFVSIKDASLKGFIYEALWDICFKANVVEDYDHSNVDHICGKIEDLRSGMKTLKVLENLYEYLKTNKVQSGNSAGVSDITMKYLTRSEKQKPACVTQKIVLQDKYVFVSSKFYTNEKSITSYDIAPITQAIKGVNADYEIVLLVNDKVSLQEKMKRTLKKYTLEAIVKVYDIYDLDIYINKLRVLLKHLQATGLSYSEVFATHFSKKIKPLLPITYETCMFYNHTVNDTKNRSWYNFDTKSLAKCILYFVMKNNQSANIISKDKVLLGHIRKYIDKYIGLNDCKIYENSDKETDIVFTDRPIKSKSRIITFSTSGYKKDTNLFWTIPDTQKESTDICLEVPLPTYPKLNWITNANKSYKSTSFETYRKYFDTELTREMIKNKETLRDIVDVIFGNPKIYLEDFVLTNQISDTPRSTIAVVIPCQEGKCSVPLQRVANNVVNILLNNPYIKNEYEITPDVDTNEKNVYDSNKNIILVTTSSLMKSRCVSTYVVLDPEISETAIYDLIAPSFLLKAFPQINVISFSSSKMV